MVCVPEFQKLISERVACRQLPEDPIRQLLIKTSQDKHHYTIRPKYFVINLDQERKLGNGGNVIVMLLRMV